MPSSMRSGIFYTVVGLGLAGVAAGVIGLRTVRGLILVDQQVARDFLPSLAALLSAEEGVAVVRLSTARAMASAAAGQTGQEEGQIDALWQDRQTALHRAETGLAQLANLPLAAEAAPLFENVRTTLSAYAAANEGLWETIRARDLPQAHRLEQSLASRFTGRLLGPLDQLVEVERGLAAAASTRAVASAARASGTLQSLIFGTLVGAVGLGWSLLRGETRLRVALAANQATVLELQGALENVRTLTGLLPICMFCKRIRNDQGYWDRIEAYISKRTDARFSHGLCPECLDENYPEEEQT
jgi:hypothetical protein